MDRSVGWSWAAAFAVLFGCSAPGPDVFPEAEALEGQGKFEEAASKFELACAYRPKDEKCPASGERAAQARVKAAEKAVAEGRYIDAEKILLRALATADGAASAKIAERLADAELKDGLRYQRASSLPDKQLTSKTLEELASTGAPAVKAKAKEWLDKERPALLVQAVRDACGPALKGSCSSALAKLKDAGLKGPEAEEVQALAEAEERRVYPLRVQAEAFLGVFASQKQKDDAVEKCFQEAMTTDVASAPAQYGSVRSGCREEHLETDWYMQRKNNENLWRRLLKSISDPELVAALEARKGEALTTGGPVKKLDIPKPKPAPKRS